MRRDTAYISVFSPNIGIYELEKLRIQIFFHAVFVKVSYITYVESRGFWQFLKIVQMYFFKDFKK